MEQWVKINKPDSVSKNNFEFIVDDSPRPIYYPVYKLHKGDIIPITLNQAIKQTDMIFNSGAFKVVDIRKDEIAGAVFKVEYIKENKNEN